MSNLNVRTIKQEREPARTIGAVIGNVLVVLVGVLACAIVVSAGVLALVTIWRSIVGA